MVVCINDVGLGFGILVGYPVSALKTPDHPGQRLFLAVFSLIWGVFLTGVMRVTLITSPVSLVLGLLGGLTQRFRAVTAGPPVSVYPATRPFFGILGWVTGVIRRSWVWRIMFCSPPGPHLLWLGQPVEHAFLSPPGGIGVLGESELAIVVLDEELEALD